MALEDRNAAGMDPALIKGREIHSSSCDIRKSTLLPTGILTVSTIHSQGQKKSSFDVEAIKLQAQQACDGFLSFFPSPSPWA